jgi:membrane protease YdiL (CAAX protease family)
MLNTIKSTLKDISGFLRKPTEIQDANQSTKQKIKRLSSLLVIDILLMIILSAIIGGFDKLGWVKTEDHQVALLIDLAPVWLVWILTVIIIPFFEEIIFRLPLRFKTNYILRPFTFIFPKTKPAILKFWNKRFGYIFYLFTIIFALIHISNYDFNSTIIYLIPFLVLPQFIMGLFLGYLRVRYNFVSAYLMHALHNAIFITIALLSIDNNPVEKLNLETDKYSINIEEVVRTKDSYMHNHKDSISFIGADFKSIMSTLTQKDIDLISSNNDNLLNKRISLHFKNNSLDSLNRDSLIIRHLSEVYSFEIEPKKRNQKVHILYVKDTLQLLKHVFKDENEIPNSSTSISLKDITFKNISLKEMAKTLSSNYKTRFESENTLQRFNIILPNTNLNELEKVLETDYGIYLNKTEKEVEYLYINFQK